MRWSDLDFIAIIFRLAVFAIVILFFSIFWGYMQQWKTQMEVAAVQKTVGDINRELALKLYKLTVESKLQDLVALDGGNPFDILKQQGLSPKSYRGSILSEAKIDQPGWYYHLVKKQVIFVGKKSKKRYEQRFLFEDKDGEPGFNKSRDSVKMLIFRRISDY